MVGCPKKKAWFFCYGIRNWTTWTEQSQILIGHLLPLWEVQKHSYDILGARMLWKPKEARILKNF
jgi:hypothetical protein